MAKDSKINSTKEIDSGSVLGSTLDGMDQWDMNKVNDVGGKHPEFNGKSPIGGKK